MQFSLVNISDTDNNTTPLPNIIPATEGLTEKSVQSSYSIPVNVKSTIEPMPNPTAIPPINLSLCSGWMSICDVYCDYSGTFIFDLTNYVPADNVIIYFMRNNHQNTFIQGTITSGLIVWDDLVPGWEYEYAIWSGDRNLTSDVSALDENQIPKYAWTKVSIDEQKHISILASSAEISILPNK